jgi:lysophospholipase L1-like esterase
MDSDGSVDTPVDIQAGCLRQRSRLSGAIAQSVVVVAITAGLLGCVELVCRVALPFPRANFSTYRADTATIYSHLPGSMGWELSPLDEFAPIRVNYDRFGFRGEDFPAKKAAGERRVFLLGDSIVEGRQVIESDTFTARLQAGEDQRARNVRVINAGVSAYTTTTANLLLRDKVLALEPDAVVLFFFAAYYSRNFIYGNYSQYEGLLSGEVPAQLLEDLGSPSISAAPLEWAKRHSAVASSIAWLKDREAATLDLTTPEPVLGTTDDFRKSARNVNKVDLNEAERKVLEFTHRGVVAMAEACRNRGIAFALVIVPFPPQVGRAEWAKGKRRFGFAEDEWMPATTYQDRLMVLARDIDVPALDLLPALKSAKSERGSEALFFNYDGHLTPRGHEAVAQATEPLLQTLLDR